MEVCIGEEIYKDQVENEFWPDKEHCEGSEDYIFSVLEEQDSFGFIEGLLRFKLQMFALIDCSSEKEK